MDELSLNGLVTFESRIDDAVVSALQGQDLSGFEIWKWLGSVDGAQARLTEARLYPTLYRLEAEGLLHSDWYDGERTRRKYRLTANASDRADDRRSSTQASRVGDPGTADPASRRAVSPDPDAGSWFVPAKEVAALPPPVAASLATDRGSPTAIVPASTGGEPGSPGRDVISGYADDLGARLDLPRVELNRVRQEIADHLRDSAQTLEQQGYASGAAAAEALRRLGSAADLARSVEQAQQTPGRQVRGLRRGVLEIVGEMAVWLALSIAPFALSLGVGDIAIGLGRIVGLHLFVLHSAEWTTNQVAVMLCIGAFASGRISLGRLARITRHSEDTLRKRWAIGGAVALLAIVLVVPAYQDGPTVVTLLAVPIAFVAGTLRPQQLHEGAYSIRAVAGAALLVTVVTLLPFSRIFEYDPNATPGTPLVGGGTSAVLSVDQNAVGAYTYGVFGAGVTGSVTVELWPASTSGLFVAPDPSVNKATISVERSGSVDLAKLPPYGQWWVTNRNRLLAASF